MAIGGESAGILLKIKADSSQGEAEIKKFKKELNDLNKTARDGATGLEVLGASSGLTASQFKSITAGAAVAGAGILAVTAAAAAGVTALFNLSKEAAEFADSISESADQMGVTTTAAQALKVAAEQSGSSFEKITGAVAKFNVLLGQAADGSDKAQATLEKYGITAKDTDTALTQAIKTIAGMASNTQQASAAAALFKDRTGEILPVIRSFKGDLPGLISKLKDMGVIMGEDDVKAGAAFQDQMDMLNEQLNAVARTIGFEVMPVFQDFATSLSQWLSKNQTEIREWANAMATSLEATANLFSSFSEKVMAATSELMKFKAIQQLSDIRNFLTTQVDPFGSAAYGAYMNVAEKRAAADREAAQMRNVVRVGPESERGSLMDGGGGGGAKKPTSKTDTRTDKQAYQDFVKALKELGVNINSGFRTFKEQADLFKRLPAGQAARPGTSDHEFWKAVDLPPGVSDALLAQAANKAGVTLGKRNVHEGTGLHNHQAFKKGVSGGGGESDIAKEVEEQKRIKDQELADAQAFVDEIIRQEQEASDQKLAIWRSEAALAVEIIQQRVEEGVLTETEAVKRLGQLKIDLLQEERNDTVAMISSTERRIKVEQLDLEIKTQQIKNARELAAIEKKRDEERKKSWNEYIKDLIRVQELEDREAERKAAETAEINRRNIESQGVRGGSFGAGIVQGLGLSIVERFGGQDQILSEAEFLKNVWTDIETSIGGSLGALAQGMANLVTQWIITGEFSAQAALKMAAGAAIGIAFEAGIKALFQLAEGLAMLANPFTAPLAAGHFAAAKAYALVAAIAGGAGVAAGLGARALGGGARSSFSQQSGAATGGASGSSQGTGQGENGNEFRGQFSGFDNGVSNQNGNLVLSLNTLIGRQTFVLGQLQQTQEKFATRIGSMNAGEVVTMGAQSAKRAIFDATVQEMNDNPRAGNEFARAKGEAY